MRDNPREARLLENLRALRVADARPITMGDDPDVGATFLEVRRQLNTHEFWFVLANMERVRRPTFSEGELHLLPWMLVLDSYTIYTGFDGDGRGAQRPPPPLPDLLYGPLSLSTNWVDREWEADEPAIPFTLEEVETTMNMLDNVVVLYRTNCCVPPGSRNFRLVGVTPADYQAHMVSITPVGAVPPGGFPVDPPRYAQWAEATLLPYAIVLHELDMLRERVERMWAPLFYSNANLLAAQEGALPAEQYAQWPLLSVFFPVLSGYYRHGMAEIHPPPPVFRDLNELLFEDEEDSDDGVVRDPSLWENSQIVGNAGAGEMFEEVYVGHGEWMLVRDGEPIPPPRRRPGTGDPNRRPLQQRRPNIGARVRSRACSVCTGTVKEPGYCSMCKNLMCGTCFARHVA